jgi:hypothetical protein
MEKKYVGEKIGLFLDISSLGFSLGYPPSMHISNGHAPTDLIFISIKMVLCSYDFYMMSVLSNIDVAE